MSTIDKFRAAFGNIAIRSVHQNVARLDAARAVFKSEDWPPNVVSYPSGDGRLVGSEVSGEVLGLILGPVL